MMNVKQHHIDVTIHRIELDCDSRWIQVGDLNRQRCKHDIRLKMKINLKGWREKKNVIRQMISF